MQSTFRFLVALTFTFVAVYPVNVSASDSTSILFSEILTGTSTGAGQEFVELYNPNTEAINLNGWSIEYKSATSANTPSNWNKKADLSGQIAGRSYFLVAPRNYYPDSDVDWSSTLSSTGGHVRLLDETGKVIDLVGYGNANSPEGSPSAAPSANQSIERLPGKSDPLAGNGIDTQDNSKDLLVRVDPEPQNTKSFPEPRQSNDVESQEPDEENEIPIESVPVLIITELFIDPESPSTDAEDEFIELYNPNDFEVNYEGYQLKGGSNFRNSYILPPGILAPKGYIAFTSMQTEIPLTNSGGSVQLFDPDARLLDQTQSYTNAKPGQSWVLDKGVWAWSLLPTKGSQNLVTLPTAFAVSSTTKKTSKPAAPKSAKVKAPAKAKKSASKSTKAKRAKENKVKSEPIKVAAAKIKPASWLIIVLAVFTISYAIYEFRNDISNSYKKIRGNYSSWRNDRKSSKGRRND